MGDFLTMSIPGGGESKTKGGGGSGEGGGGSAGGKEQFVIHLAGGLTTFPIKNRFVFPAISPETSPLIIQARLLTFLPP